MTTTLALFGNKVLRSAFPAQIPGFVQHQAGEVHSRISVLDEIEAGGQRASDLCTRVALFQVPVREVQVKRIEDALALHPEQLQERLRELRIRLADEQEQIASIRVLHRPPRQMIARNYR